MGLREWWTLVGTGASQVHLLILELDLSAATSCPLSMKLLLLMAQGSWFVMLNAKSHVFNVGSLEEGCRQFQF